MRNNDFIMDYVKGNIDRRCICNHLASDGFKLSHYSTIICELDFDRHFAYVNNRKYSTTTSKIQSRLIQYLNGYDWKIVYYDGPQASYWNCGYQGAPRMTKEDIPFWFLDHAHKHIVSMDVEINHKKERTKYAIHERPRFESKSRTVPRRFFIQIFRFIYQIIRRWM